MALRIEWSEDARAEVRRLDKPTAEHVCDVQLRFTRTGQGGVKKLHGQLEDRSRLRIVTSD